jgi:hypothetical protein
VELMERKQYITLCECHGRKYNCNNCNGTGEVALSVVLVVTVNLQVTISESVDGVTEKKNNEQSIIKLHLR